MDAISKHRLCSTWLYLGYGAYLFLCVGIQILLFKRYAGTLGGIHHLGLVPFAALLKQWNPAFNETAMPIAMWLQMAALMIPFGFCLFLWVEDCNSIKSIAAITFCFSCVLCAANYILTAPIFEMDFIVSSVCGAFMGYAGARGLVELLYTKRIHPLLAASPKNLKKIA